jgi:hypothetical protein
MHLPFDSDLKMSKTFKRGDHVEWNSEAGRVRGTVVKKVVSDVKFKGYTHHATKEEPQYFIKGQIGLFEQHPRLQVPYNQYALHVGA